MISSFLLITTTIIIISQIAPFLLVVFFFFYRQKTKKALLFLFISSRSLSSSSSSNERNRNPLFLGFLTWILPLSSASLLLRMVFPTSGPWIPAISSGFSPGRVISPAIWGSPTRWRRDPLDPRRRRRSRRSRSRAAAAEAGGRGGAWCRCRRMRRRSSRPPAVAMKWSVRSFWLLSVFVDDSDYLVCCFLSGIAVMCWRFV